MGMTFNSGMATRPSNFSLLYEIRKSFICHFHCHEPRSKKNIFLWCLLSSSAALRGKKAKIDRTLYNWWPLSIELLSGFADDHLSLLGDVRHKNPDLCLLACLGLQIIVIHNIHHQGSLCSTFVQYTNKVRPHSYSKAKFDKQTPPTLYSAHFLTHKQSFGRQLPII